jgi:hypothetical protein
MSSITLNGDTSGSIIVQAPAIAGSGTLTLPSGASGTIAAQGVSTNIVSGTSVSASGTAIDFTSIPSWVKRITIMFNGVSLSGSDHYLVQIGSGSVTSSGYTSLGNAFNQASGTGGTTSTSGFVMFVSDAAGTIYVHMMLTLISGNTWVSSHSGAKLTNNAMAGGGSVALSGALDRVRITTTGSNTFDAGTINILYE